MLLSMGASATSASSATAWQSCALLCTSASARLIKPGVLLSVSACALSASSATTWPPSMSSSAWQSCALLNKAPVPCAMLITLSVLLSMRASASSASTASSATA